MIKKLVLLCILFAYLLVPCHSQTLLQGEKTWYSHNFNNYGGPPPFWEHTYINKLGNDTIIEGLHYRILLYSTDSTLQQFSTYRYLRETPDGKVYFRSSPQAGSPEYLAYDFSAEVGDTLKFHCIHHITGELSFVVTNVFNELFAGKMRKTIYFSGLTMERWIEGIGSTEGIIFNGHGYYVDIAWFLACYFENDTLKFHSGTSAQCYIEYVGIDESQVNYTNSISILPNPVIGTSTIRLSEALQNDPSCKFELYNLMGVRVSTFQLSICKTITNDNLVHGLYYYKIFNKTGVCATGKVIIQ